MTDVTSDTEAGKAAASGAGAADDGLAAELVASALPGGVKLTGEGGLLQQLTKRVLELLTALSVELPSSCSRSWKRWCASWRVFACAALAPAVSACSWAASARAPAVQRWAQCRGGEHRPGALHRASRSVHRLYVDRAPQGASDS